MTRFPAMTTLRDGLSAASAQSRIDDVRIRDVREISPPIDLLHELPASTAVGDVVCDARASISRILAGEDPRLLVVVGPCSIHNVPAALEYARAIREFSRQFRHWLLIVMRVYFEKPRTRGGWKGLINDPDLAGTVHINDGLRLARQLLLESNGMAATTATPLADPTSPQCIAEPIAWAAIAAPTAGSRVHTE